MADSTRVRPSPLDQPLLFNLKRKFSRMINPLMRIHVHDQSLFEPYTLDWTPIYTKKEGYLYYFVKSSAISTSLEKAYWCNGQRGFWRVTSVKPIYEYNSENRVVFGHITDLTFYISPSQYTSWYMSRIKLHTPNHNSDLQEWVLCLVGINNRKKTTNNAIVPHHQPPFDQPFIRTGDEDRRVKMEPVDNGSHSHNPTPLTLDELEEFCTYEIPPEVVAFFEEQQTKTPIDPSRVKRER